MRSFINRFHLLVKDERGGVLILVALLIITLLGMAALAVDVGLLYSARRQMVNAADSAALAGAQELIIGGDAVAVAVHYATNENHADNAEASLGNYNGSADYNTVTVNTVKNVDYLFARALSLGRDNSDVTATATALIAPIVEKGGLIPIGITEAVYAALTGGEEYTLITFANFGIIGPGNWGWVNLTGSHGQQSTHDQVDNIIYGYPELKKVGDQIYTDTGGNLGAPGILNTYDWKLDEYIANGTVLYVPILSNDWSSGTSAIMTILGFAPIVLLDYEFDAQSFKIKAEIQKPQVDVGPINPNAPDFGLKGITLIE